MKKILFILPFVLFACSHKDIKVVSPIPSDDIEDIDGNRYKTVRIGDQIWMTENLRSLHFQDGTPIEVADTPYVTTAYPESYEKGPVCFMPDSQHSRCGVYYNWKAVAKNPCPAGWRVPSRKDLQILVNNLGGVDKAGALMKSIDGWKEPNKGVGETSYMNVLPSAQYILSQDMIDKGKTNGFDEYGYYAMLWTSDEGNAWTATGIYLSNLMYGIVFQDNAKTSGICVRCMIDALSDF